MRLWSEGAKSKVPFGTLATGASHLEAAENLKDWTRRRFELSDRVTIVVTEVAGSLPGFPPLETGVAFWTDGGVRHHFRVFKPVEAITAEDLPPSWLKASLAASDGIDCYCC